jgi:hypothetical protein
MILLLDFCLRRCGAVDRRYRLPALRCRSLLDFTPVLPPLPFRDYCWIAWVAIPLVPTYVLLDCRCRSAATGCSPRSSCCRCWCTFCCCRSCLRGVRMLGLR